MALTGCGGSPNAKSAASPAAPWSDLLQISATAIPDGTEGSPYGAPLSATGGTKPYRWNLASGTLPSGMELNQASGMISGMPVQAGDFSFSVRVSDARSHTAVRDFGLMIATAGGDGNGSGNDGGSGGGGSNNENDSGFDGPAELPRTYIPTSLADTASPGKIILVNAGGDFQSALDNAGCGDKIELQAGATFSGKFTLPAKTCDGSHWITIRSSAADSALPVQGTRVTPCYAGVASLPGRPVYSCPQPSKTLATISFPNSSGSGPIVLAPGANHYRLLGLEITRQPGTGGITALISTESDSDTADHIVVDRSWLHGTAHDETRRGVALRGTTYFAIIDSYLTDFHCVSTTGTCTDAQDISGGSGDNPGGPYRIVDNFLEAAGENIMFGGSEATTTPADIEIRRNHFFKPLTWLQGDSHFVGGTSGNPFAVKNHFELKNAQRVLLEGNILENNWGGFSQHGYSILLTPKNQNDGGVGICPLCQVTDVTIRYNKVSHTGAGISIATNLDTPAKEPALAGAHYSIHDIIIDDVNSVVYSGNGTLIQTMNTWLVHVLHDVTINHITGFPDPATHMLTVGDEVSNPKMQGFTFTNNIVAAGRYPVWSALGGTTDCSLSDVPAAVLASCFDGYSFVSNLMLATYQAFPPSSWPSGNFFAPDPNTIFVNFNNGDGGDYHLPPSSPYRNAGTDGKDLGADIDAIDAATTNVY